MKKIGVVTTSRADYGILEPLLHRLESDSELELMLYVSGTHLQKEYGYSYSAIQGKFKNIYQVPIPTSQTKSEAIAKSLGSTLIEFEKSLNKNKPDILILLGDRVELMPIALVASLLHIPIAHLHGGELTFGAMDECIRHSVTKFSHLHFTSCEEYRKRVIQLGESPERVFNVGSLALESISKSNLLSKAELEESLGVNFGNKNIVVTLHPETLETKEYQIEMVDNVLSALELLPNSYFILFTSSNADLFGEILNERIQKFVSSHSNTRYVSNLGAQKYYSILKNFDLCMGNSSSGVIEAPSLGIPTLNIGRRQAGRIRAKSVTDISINKHEIQSALTNILTKKPEHCDNPYFKKGTLDLITNVLKKTDFTNILQKEFYDLNMDSIL